MSHTHTNLLTHVVFSTQGFLPLIPREMKAELFAYMAALVKELKGKAIITNGMSDHVHMLILLPPNVSMSDANAVCESEFVAMGQGEVCEEVCLAERIWSV